MTCDFRVDDSFEDFRDLFAICNHSNTFFARYVFYIIILFFRYNNDFIFLFEKTNYELAENFAIIFWSWNIVFVRLLLFFLEIETIRFIITFLATFKAFDIYKIIIFWTTSLTLFIITISFHINDIWAVFTFDILFHNIKLF